ncbi:hypothetical protein B9Y78_08125 [Stenotrophomonas maltophilia]|uniref:hypothetical protein n=1 Tax=Stenotrophomonas maltophilia TaxID=40324 RepID=UPI000C25BB9C|nr:hypothetical protein [Stenotrophomonas maltophilia]PJL41062.1 hypothetical protein B9Y78_08125 [Stenotrophomonas maltophilia]
MNEMDAKGAEFVDACQDAGTFGAALRLLDTENIRIISRKVPMNALAQLLRQAADICEQQAGKDRLN